MKKRFDIVTIFPDVCTPYAGESILGRAQKKKLIEVQAHDLRKYSADKKHTRVDDKPFGGGPGMVMQVEPFDRAIRKIRTRSKKAKTRVIVTSASGKRFTQQDVVRLAKYDQLIFLCGRYEGIDHRVEKHFADESLSIGDYVLAHGYMRRDRILDDLVPPEVPVPAAAWLFGSGLAGLMGAARRRTRSVSTG